MVLEDRSLKSRCYQEQGWFLPRAVKEGSVLCLSPLFASLRNSLAQSRCSLCLHSAFCKYLCPNLMTLTLTPSSAKAFSKQGHTHRIWGLGLSHLLGEHPQPIPNFPTFKIKIFYLSLSLAEHVCL